MITVRDLQQNTTFAHVQTGELFDVEDANAQVKDANANLWIPCVIYTKTKVTSVWDYQRFVKDVPDFLQSFSLPEK